MIEVRQINFSLNSQENQTPLHVASGRGHVECVRGLVGAGACVDCQDAHGATPLHHSLARHHTQAAMILLHAGANTDITDDVSDYSLVLLQNWDVEK